EEPSKSQWNGAFISDVEVTRREGPEPNHRGCFRGHWRIISSAGKPLAEGSWQGAVEGGTQHGINDQQCEPCSDPAHFEGFLVGEAVAQSRAVGPAKICASVQGRGLLPKGDQSGVNPALFNMRIEGIATIHCQAQTPGGGWG